MTWAYIKHFLLGALIVLSLFLSFNLLTAGEQVSVQPTSGTNTTPALVDRTISEVFSPHQVILHEQYESPQIAELEDVNDLIERSYESIIFNDVQSPEEFSESNYVEMLQQDSWVEFVYDGSIPFGLFENGFENLPSDYENRTFNRVLFNLEDEQRVLFYNARQEIIYEIDEITTVGNVIAEFRESEEINYTEADILNLAEMTYVPISSVSIPYRNYLVERLPDSLYTNEFFPETSEVDSRPTGDPDTKEFVNLTTVVMINDETNTITYSRQRTDADELSLNERLTSSFQELKLIENWTDQSLYQSYNPATKQVTFQRYLEGLPVFSPQQLESTVQVSVTENGRSWLRVPLRVVQVSITLDGFEDKELPSGSEMASRLEAAGVDLSTVDELKIGLTWKESEEDDRVIHFEPDWYVSVEDDSNWYQVEQFITLQEDTLNGL